MSTKAGIQSLAKRTNVEENPFLPIEKKLSTPVEFKRFLTALNENEGYISRAAAATNISERTVYHRLKEYPDFDRGVKMIRKQWRKWRLERLETVAFGEAMKAKNFRERKFLMESLNPVRYRSTYRDLGPANINITFGFQMPQERYGMGSKQEVEGIEAEVVDVDEPIDDKDSLENSLNEMDFEV